MAENYAITMTEKNDVDYDNLFPQTVSPQVLLDANARATQGLAAGATLNDSITDIVENGGASQVGDTLITARTNLGDKWLLENGASLQKADYPELAQVMGKTLGSKTKSTTVASNATSNKFRGLSFGKNSELLFSYVSPTQYSTYPFAEISATEGVGGFGNIVYDTIAQKYYTGKNDDLYSGDTLSTLSVFQTPTTIKNGSGAFHVNNNIYFFGSWVSDSVIRGAIYKKDASGDSATRIFTRIPNAPGYANFMYTDDTYYYIFGPGSLTTDSANIFATNSSLEAVTFDYYEVSISSVQTKKVYPNGAMGQYNGTLCLCGYISGYDSVQVWITKDRQNWIKVSTGINPSHGFTNATVVVTENKLFYTINLGDTTSIYQIDITGTTYNPVLSYTLQDTLTYGIYDDVNNRIYYTNTVGNIYSFTIDDGILLPKFSPGSGGLYAYMKVKP